MTGQCVVTFGRPHSTMNRWKPLNERAKTLTYDTAYDKGHYKDKSRECKNAQGETMQNPQTRIETSISDRPSQTHSQKLTPRYDDDGR